MLVEYLGKVRFGPRSLEHHYANCSPGRSRRLNQTRYGYIFDKDSRILRACNKASKKKREREAEAEK